MNVEQAIKMVVNNYGINTLSSPKRFQSLVKDFADTTDSEITLFCICCQAGVLELMQRLFLIDDKWEIEILAKKARQKLIERYMAEEHATIGINMFLKGLGKSYILEPSSKKRVDGERVDGSRSFEDKKGTCYKKYSFNVGTTKDDIESFLYFLEKVAEGNISAIIAVADCYRKGHIVKKNLRISECYYKMAIEKGSEEARQKYMELINERRRRRTNVI